MAEGRYRLLERRRLQVRSQRTVVSRFTQATLTADDKENIVNVVELTLELIAIALASFALWGRWSVKRQNKPKAHRKMQRNWPWV